MDVVNGDLSQRVAIATAKLPWIPRGDHHEKLLEQTAAGDRRTALVHLAAGASLPIAGTGSLDILIHAGSLAGHRAPAFLHEPAGDRALVATEPTTLFVKQRPARAPARVAIDLAHVVYEPGHSPGLSRALLHADDDGDVVLLWFAPGCVIGPHLHDNGEEFLVLFGSIRDEVGSYGLHDWVRQPPDSVHSIASPEGCLFFTFAHHLF